MTDPIRDLLISLSSHMAYMQGQLEAHHQYDDPEDYYWYRESVALRQKVIDALADGPAVFEGREPASVAMQPSDEELNEFAVFWWGSDTDERTVTDVIECCSMATFARAALDRWGTPNQAEIRSSLGAAPAPVPVSERLPGPEDCDAEGRCWFFHTSEIGGTEWFFNELPRVDAWFRWQSVTYWLPANALPLPAPEVQL